MRLDQIAETLAARLLLPPGSPAATEIEIDRVAPLDRAGPCELSFLTGAAFARFLSSTRAAAVIVAAESEDCPVPQLVHANPRWAFARAAQLFWQPPRPPEGVDERAWVAEDAVVGAGVAIAPFAYVGSGARLGDRVALFPGACVGAGAVIGDDTVVRANAVIEEGVRVGKRVLIHAGVVIGGDGFGFEAGEDGIAKIPQTGAVELGDDVEVGANSTVDRGALEDTVIGRDTKLDSLVQVGHGARVGEHTRLCAYTAVAGSARIGDWVIFGGRSGIDSGCELPDRSAVAAMSAVTKTVRAPGLYAGFPAMPADEWRKTIAAGRRLPRLLDRVRRLEARLEALESDGKD
jgi:UDP-3-O-[3-hydroxymyristoyl] glucosamine N-acyltransferase